jgi:hypothetical protein
MNYLVDTNIFLQTSLNLHFRGKHKRKLVSEINFE